MRKKKGVSQNHRNRCLSGTFPDGSAGHMEHILTAPPKASSRKRFTPGDTSAAGELFQLRGAVYFGCAWVYI